MANLTDVLTQVSITQPAKKNKNSDTQKAEAAKYIRVGDEFYKNIKSPDKNGVFKDELSQRSRQTVRDEVKGFYSEITAYEGFCNVPGHVNFVQTVGDHYNKYKKLTHTPKEGNFDNIIRLLKHLFKDHYDFILDYFQLLYLEPTMRLPVLIVESEEKNTGKSTFGGLITSIFQDNAIKVGNTEIASDFNAIWAMSLVIVVDETKIDSDLVVNMMKRFTTETGKVTINEKGKKQFQIDYFGKMVLISNHEGEAIPISKDENRFAVFKAPTLESSGLKDDPEMEDKIKAEIPAFLHYLMNRELKYKKKESRMYFPFEAYKTKQLELYYKKSGSALSRAILSFISDCFSAFPNTDYLKFSAKELLEEMINTKRVKQGTVMGVIKNAMTDELKIPLNDKKGRYKLYRLSHYENGNTGENYSGEDGNNSYYSFDRDTFAKY